MLNLKQKSVRECTQIPQSELVEGVWYVGRGRNANIGLYEDERFTVICNSLVYNGSFATPQKTQPGVKSEPYFTPDKGCFQPFSALSSLSILTENQSVIPKQQLLAGKFYIGKRENFDVARWEGGVFSLLKRHYVSQSVYHYDIESLGYSQDAKCFRPLLEIDEGQVAVALSEQHYAQVLRI